MAKKAKRNIADEAMRIVIAEALKSKKLIQRMLKTIEGDLKLRAQFTAIIGEPLAQQVLAEPETRYYGPPDSQFESGRRILYEFYLSRGASKNVASGLNSHAITPRELFSMPDRLIREKRRLGEKTIEFAASLREMYSKPN